MGLKSYTPPQPAPAPAPPAPEPKKVAMSTGKINQEGLDLIKSCEGLYLSAYPDPASALGRACREQRLSLTGYRKVAGWEALSGAPWTIGYGQTGPDVVPGRAINAAEAESILAAALGSYEQGIVSLLKRPVSDNAFSALVSFCYNLGVGTLGKSTLLKLLNDGDMAGAADEFLKYNKAGRPPEVLPGLTKRRAAERTLFLKA